MTEERQHPYPGPLQGLYNNRRGKEETEENKTREECLNPAAEENILEPMGNFRRSIKNASMSCGEKLHADSEGHSSALAASFITRVDVNLCVKNIGDGRQLSFSSRNIFSTLLLLKSGIRWITPKANGPREEQRCPGVTRSPSDSEPSTGSPRAGTLCPLCLGGGARNAIRAWLIIDVSEDPEWSPLCCRQPPPPRAALLRACLSFSFFSHLNG